MYVAFARVAAHISDSASMAGMNWFFQLISLPDPSPRWMESTTGSISARWLRFSKYCPRCTLDYFAIIVSLNGLKQGRPAP